MNWDGSWSRRHFEYVERWRTGCPAIAEDRLEITVDVSKMRGSGVHSEKKGSFVEGLIHLLAKAEAGLIAAGE